MDASRFKDNAPGQLVKIATQYGEDWGFVPAPLPPKVNLDQRLWNSVAETQYALGALAGLGSDISNPTLFIRPFIRREAVLGSIIEGTVVDISDLYAYEAGQLTLPGIERKPPEAALREVYNYVKTIEYGLEKTKLPLSLRLLRELHRRLMAGVRGGTAGRGEFRDLPGGIRGRTLKEAAYIGPPVRYMHECLDALEKFLHAETDLLPLIRIALVHYQFEAIHPFRDGNGRIGRLLIHLLFVFWKLLPLPLLYVSRYFERHRDAYCDLLFEVSAKGAWRDWLFFFLDAVRTEAFDTTARINSLHGLQRKWRERLVGGGSSNLPFRLSDTLFEVPYITIPRAAKLLDVTYSGAKRAVDRLVNAGILSQLTRSSYNKIFLAEEVLDIIKG